MHSVHAGPLIQKCVRGVYMNCIISVLSVYPYVLCAVFYSMSHWALNKMILSYLST